ncbi:hypothetical protein ACRAWF_23110 [Streptomyces sp. L7]
MTGPRFLAGAGGGSGHGTRLGRVAGDRDRRTARLLDGRRGLLGALAVQVPHRDRGSLAASTFAIAWPMPRAAAGDDRDLSLQ